MARGPTFVVKFRRRREGKTDYKKRLQYIKSGKLRFVVRISNKHCLCQIIKYSPSGDVTLATARSIELKNYGYKGSTGNKKAAYLTGYLCTKRSEKKKMIMDIVLQHPHPKGRLYSALKGAVDAGAEIPHEKEILPPDDSFKELAAVREKIDKSPKKKTKAAKPKKKPARMKKPAPKKKAKKVK